MFEVRQSICVTGVNREAVIKVKGLIDSVTSETLPLESFHVKLRSDLTDGAMLVPKVVLAAAHCPGQRFIDQTPASVGQLDFLYDEVCKIGGKSTICLPPSSNRSVKWIFLKSYTPEHPNRWNNDMLLCILRNGLIGLCGIFSSSSSIMHCRFLSLGGLTLRRETYGSRVLGVLSSANVNSHIGTKYSRCRAEDKHQGNDKCKPCHLNHLLFYFYGTHGDKLLEHNA